MATVLVGVFASLLHFYLFCMMQRKTFGGNLMETYGNLWVSRYLKRIYIHRALILLCICTEIWAYAQHTHIYICTHMSIRTLNHKIQLMNLTNLQSCSSYCLGGPPCGHTHTHTRRTYGYLNGRWWDTSKQIKHVICDCVWTWGIYLPTKPLSHMDHWRL